jgi:hypothetical protein
MAEGLTPYIILEQFQSFSRCVCGGLIKQPQIAMIQVIDTELVRVVRSFEPAERLEIMPIPRSWILRRWGLARIGLMY